MRRWTEDEDLYMVRAVIAGQKVLGIAIDLGRSEWACYARLHLLKKAGVPVPELRHKIHLERRA